MRWDRLLFGLGILLTLLISFYGCEPGEIEHHCKSPWTCPLPEPRPAEHRPHDGGTDSLETEGEEE